MKISSKSIKLLLHKILWRFRQIEKWKFLTTIINKKLCRGNFCSNNRFCSYYEIFIIASAKILWPWRPRQAGNRPRTFYTGLTVIQYTVYKMIGKPTQILQVGNLRHAPCKKRETILCIGSKQYTTQLKGIYRQGPLVNKTSEIERPQLWQSLIDNVEGNFLPIYKGLLRQLFFTYSIYCMALHKGHVHCI